MSRLPQESSLHTEAAGSASPDAFGPFRVLHQIGAGALGPVFRAYEPERDRLVAVKVFRLDLPPERAHQLVAEFERLIETGLDHPSITAPVATGLDGVVAYLAQDYFSGDSLDIVMRENGPSSVADALRVARQLAEALDFAVERGVEHGAIHPRDVLLSAEGTRLIGFGITRALERVGAGIPIRRPYTPPERVDGAAWDRRADVFGLAAVVHEMLWGRRLVGTGMEAVEGMTPLPGTHLTALQAVFARALAEQPVDRFATATEFLESLEGAVNADAPATDAQDTVIAEPPVSRAPHGRFRAVEPLLPLEDESASSPEPELLLISPEPEPEPEPELEPEPLELQERLEPVEPLKAVEPPFLLSTAAFSPAPSSSSLVWPIGVACLVGLAIGFGAGYTVALRDRASVAAPVNDAKAGDDVQLPAEPIAPAVAAAVKPAAPEAPKPAPFDGRLVVRSTPSGARVVVDGRDRGATPATVGDLSRGEHRVRVVRDGYTAAERRIVLSPSRPSQLLSVPLAKAPLSTKLAVVQQPKADASPGTLVVESRPEGATVFVDAKAVGRTPLTLPNVKAGDHALRLELDGFRQWTAPFKIVGGAPNRVGASLEK